MSKKTRIILNIVLGLVLIGCIIGLVFWSIHCWELDRNLFLNEYNAQMEKFGYYNNHIMLLDQYADVNKYVWSFIGNVFGWILVCGAILANILFGVTDSFSKFK